MNKLFLSLIRLGVGNSTIKTEEPIPDNIDWSKIIHFAKWHGLLAILLDGYSVLVESGLATNNRAMNKELQWKIIATTLKSFEWRYKQYLQAVSELANFYNSHNIKMMLLKGYACGYYWPKPEHRPYGDIDIWNFGKHKESDQAIKRELGISIDKGHHHHTVFFFKEQVVENHYDFVNVYSHRSNACLEKIFKELGKDDSNVIDIEGSRVYIPSPNLGTLFILRHSLVHFAASGINLRQVLDWGFYVKSNTKSIDWNWLIEIAKQYKMIDFLSCLNSICVEYLNFSKEIFPDIISSPKLKNKVFNDIMTTKYQEKFPKKLLPRIIYKYRRWKGNLWKHKMCYPENIILSFIRSCWSHIIKPSSI